MPDPEVELVAGIADAFNRRDLDRLLALLAPDVEHRDLRSSGGPVLRGRDALRTHFLEIWNEHPRARFKLEAPTRSREWVIVRQRWRGLGEGETTTWVARRLDDDRVRRIVVCGSEHEALAHVDGD